MDDMPRYEKDKNSETINVEPLIRQSVGESYSHEYDRYMDFFKRIAYSREQVEVMKVPPCWVPFILWLGHKVVSQRTYWDCDKVDWAAMYRSMEDPRRAVEIASGCRPELVHALYLADTEWNCSRPTTDKFVCTGNGSFFRYEVMEYLRLLRSYTPSKECAVLAPCSASKPYPAPLHREIRKRIPSSWDIIIVTGVLGLVPEDLWPEMPNYDSGLPHRQRVQDTTHYYFSKHNYKHLVGYIDHYASDVQIGLSRVSGPTSIKFLFGCHVRDTYEQLRLETHLDLLEVTVKELS